jgi:uncharacterized protein YdeI (YjbR/CyaY-like superfamily)
MSAKLDSLAKVEPRSRQEWRDWLAANHDRSGSVWLVLRKKAAGPVPLELEAACEEAICFGWIDSLPRKLDAERSMLLLSPRKARSLWSAVNKRRAERMMATGLMAPAGQAKIDQAKQDGTWVALDDVEALETPGDLASALATLPGATEAFAGFPRSAKRGILEWILQARTPETRARRIAETAAKAAVGERANQWRRPAKR